MNQLELTTIPMKTQQITMFLFYVLTHGKCHQVTGQRTRSRKMGVISAVLITRVGTLIVATTNLQLIQNIYMFRSFTVLQCSHQRCVQPVASDVEVVGYL